MQTLQRQNDNIVLPGQIDIAEYIPVHPASVAGGAASGRQRHKIHSTSGNSAGAAAPDEGKTHIRSEKKMLKVSLTKITNPCPGKLKAAALDDGSVRLIAYKEYPVKDRVKVDQFKGYLYGYDSSATKMVVSINDPQPRDLMVCISIVRTSANNYTVVYSDTAGTSITNCKGYDEVNRCLTAAGKALK